MRRILKITVAAAALAGAAMLGSLPAQAQGFAIGIGPAGGINFSLSTGGYCDEYGCPDQFWDYPVYYCPVYYHGGWYRGPVYYRNENGDVQFWVRGAWHHDQWDGPRPDWACTDRFGPALGFEYYDGHGFRMRDEWRTWFHVHGHHGPGPFPGGPHWGPPNPGWWHPLHPGPIIPFHPVPHPGPVLHPFHPGPFIPVHPLPPPGPHPCIASPGHPCFVLHGPGPHP